MAELIIREGNAEEVAKFALWNEDNEGEAITIAEHEGAVVAYMQHTGAYIYFIESNLKGAGVALVAWLKAQNDYLCAVNVQNSEGFWAKQGFEKAGGTVWDWYAE